MSGQETWNSEWFDLEEVDLKLCLQDLNPQIFHGIKELKKQNESLTNIWDNTKAAISDGFQKRTQFLCPLLFFQPQSEMHHLCCASLLVQIICL